MVFPFDRLQTLISSMYVSLSAVVEDGVGALSLDQFETRRRPCRPDHVHTGTLGQLHCRDANLMCTLAFTLH